MAASGLAAGIAAADIEAAEHGLVRPVPEHFQVCATTKRTRRKLHRPLVRWGHGKSSNIVTVTDFIEQSWMGDLRMAAHSIRMASHSFS
jgi:hypothetical protein